MFKTELEANANEIINTYAGSPLEIKRHLKRFKLRYVKVRKGGNVRYIVRSTVLRNFKTIIKL